MVGALREAQVRQAEQLLKAQADLAKAGTPALPSDVRHRGRRESESRTGKSAPPHLCQSFKPTEVLFSLTDCLCRVCRHHSTGIG